MPRISVIMGVYNAVNRMDEAIDSIIKQTFTDWEFIICDDGSVDDTYSRLLEWSKIDNRIIPIRNEVNRGLAATLNHCIEHATGEYIARMDDDDYSYPHRFEKQVDFLDNNREYAFCSSIVLLYDGVKTYAPLKNMKEKPEAEDFLRNTCFIHPATVFRAEALKRAGCYRVAKEISRTEDYDLFMHMYALGMKGYNIQEPLLRYYVNLDA
ncbi:MAG TPA: glycosyltransferase family 2 protein, partial [Gallicola sp.]|nr:glycosyltransferase family 2 protein [Gallicola sp.]